MLYALTCSQTQKDTTILAFICAQNSTAQQRMTRYSLDGSSQWPPPPPPSPKFLSPRFSLPPSEEVAPLSGRSTETSQSEGRCHNKQKQHSNPPKSNQEPLIHPLNGDWVPWEWLIQYDHRQHDRGIHNSFVSFTIILFSLWDSNLSTQRWHNHHSTKLRCFFFLQLFICVPQSMISFFLLIRCAESFFFFWRMR